MCKPFNYGSIQSCKNLTGMSEMIFKYDYTNEHYKSHSERTKEE